MQAPLEADDKLAPEWQAVLQQLERLLPHLQRLARQGVDSAALEDAAAALQVAAEWDAATQRLLVGALVAFPRRMALLNQAPPQQGEDAGAVAAADWDPLLGRLFGARVQRGSASSALVLAPAQQLPAVLNWLTQRPAVQWVAPAATARTANWRAAAVAQVGVGGWEGGVGAKSLYSQPRQELLLPPHQQPRAASPPRTRHSAVPRSRAAAPRMLPLLAPARALMQACIRYGLQTSQGLGRSLAWATPAWVGAERGACQRACIACWEGNRGAAVRVRISSQPLTPPCCCGEGARVPPLCIARIARLPAAPCTCPSACADPRHCFFADPSVDWEAHTRLQDGIRVFDSERHRKIRWGGAERPAIGMLNPCCACGGHAAHAGLHTAAC